MFGTRKNHKTGKLETYELQEPVDLESSRKELRDFIHGNYEWHEDPYSIREVNADLADAVDVMLEDDQYADFLHNYQFIKP